MHIEKHLPNNLIFGKYLKENAHHKLLENKKKLLEPPQDLANEIEENKFLYSYMICTFKEDGVSLN